MNFMKMRTFYKKKTTSIYKKNSILHTQTSNMSFIKNSIFGTLRDPCLPKMSIWSKKGLTSTVASAKAEDMYCNQADSAILKLSFVQASMEQIYCITKQTYVAMTLLCRGMGYVSFTRVMSWIAFCRQYALFGFVLCRLLRRHLGFDSDFAQISGPKIGGWQLCCQQVSKSRLNFNFQTLTNLINWFSSSVS